MWLRGDVAAFLSGFPDKSMKVTEVMGESRFSFTIPMQLL